MIDIENLFAVSVAELVDPEVQVLLPASDLSEWEISKSDFVSLTSIGLPLVELAMFIPNAEPGVSIQQFGAYRGYSIGVIPGLEVCILAGSNAVVGVPTDPAYSFCHINSSAVKYVDCSWRHFQFLEQMKDYPPSLEMYDLHDRFLELLISIDPMIADPAIDSLWRGVVQGW